MNSSANGDFNIEEISNQIIEAVKITLEPNSSYEQHLLAHEFLEKTKDDTSLAVPCGFFLSGSKEDPQIRHLGLQFLEDTIKYHWNDISIEKKVFIKENVMLLISTGMQDILVEPIYVKDKVSRLVVEMMKREWPQQWPSLLEELEKIANMGLIQAELVLLVFLRIGEDVATLQNIESNQRRKDLHQTLNQNMDLIFTFFFNLLDTHYTKYKENSSEENSLKHCRITQVVFSVLSCYVEWVTTRCIKKHQSKFFISMCQLISDTHIRQSAVEGLLQIVSRKGKADDRKFILSLFSEDVMEHISNAAKLSVIEPLDEKNYLFLKLLTQVITTLGSQLCGLWGKEPGVGEPGCFRTYLSTLLAFTRHPSLTIYSYTNFLWLYFFRNDFINTNSTLLTFLPEWLLVAYSKIAKHGFPSKGESVTCQYSSLDFDCDQEYYLFFCKTRSDTCEAIKAATPYAPEPFFSFVEKEFDNVLQSQGLTPEALHCRWDSLSHIVEKIMSQIVVEKKGYTVPKERVKVLLARCLAYNPSHPDILSSLLTCLSGLCALLPLIPEVLHDVLHKLFESISFSGGLAKERRTKPVKNVRKHAASLLLRLCKTFPAIFMKAFSSIKEKFALLQRSADLSQLERITVMQACLILNSSINDYNVQHAYIEELSRGVREEWLSLREAFVSSSSLMTFVGLNSSGRCPRDEDAFAANRSKVFGCVDFALALSNRCKVSAEGEAAAAGGFTFTHSDLGTLSRNPAAPHLLALLPNVFLFFRAYNGLHLAEAAPSHMTRLDYARVFAVPDEEKTTLLGMRGPMPAVAEGDEGEGEGGGDDEYREKGGGAGAKSPSQKMQIFLRNIYENLCQILGNCSVILGVEFYEFPHLCECLIQSLFWNFQFLPNLKLRFLIKTLRRFIEACPPHLHETVVLPLIHQLTPAMMTLFDSKWEHFSQSHAAENGDDDDAADTDAAVEDLLLYTISRDYLEVIGHLLTNKTSGGSGRGVPPPSDAVEDAGPDAAAMDTDDLLLPPLVSETLSPLGRLALRCDPVCQSIVLTLLRALSWPDTVCCRKCIQPLSLCVQEMMDEGQQHLNEDAVRQVFTCVLAGIHTHGQHKADLDSLLDLAISLFERLNPHFPVLRQVLVALPAVDLRSVVEFETSIQRTKKGNKNKKVKREAFRKAIHSIIGKSVGETLKKDVQFTELNPIFRHRKHDQPHVGGHEAGEDLNLCSLFGAAVGE